MNMKGTDPPTHLSPPFPLPFPGPLPIVYCCVLCVDLTRPLFSFSIFHFLFFVFFFPFLNLLFSVAHTYPTMPRSGLTSRGQGVYSI